MEVTEAMAATEAMVATVVAMAATEVLELQHMVATVVAMVAMAATVTATEAMVAMDRIKDIHHKVVMVAINKINTKDSNKVKIIGKANRILEMEISTVVEATNNARLTTVHKTNFNPLTVIEFASF